MTAANRDGPIVAVPKPDPFRVAVLVVCALYAAFGSVWWDRLASTSLKLYPYQGGRVFLILLGVGAGTALGGMTVKSLPAVRVQAAGMWLLTSTGMAFTVWTPFAVGARGLPAMLFAGVLVAIPALVVARRLGRCLAEARIALHGTRSGEHPWT